MRAGPHTQKTGANKGFRFVSTRRASNPGVRGETRGVTLDRGACQTIAGYRLLDCCFLQAR